MIYKTIMGTSLVLPKPSADMILSTVSAGFNNAVISL